jgi:hypothetical protein
MNFDEFQLTLSGETPPPGLSDLLRALWLDHKGDFDGAHRIAQDIDTADGARLHAYLHRKEGDLPNAGYWYRQAGARVETASLDAEWKALALRFLQR